MKPLGESLAFNQVYEHDSFDDQLRDLCAAALHVEDSARMLLSWMQMNSFVYETSNFSYTVRAPALRPADGVRNHVKIAEVSNRLSAARVFARHVLRPLPIRYWMWLSKNGTPRMEVDGLSPEERCLSRGKGLRCVLADGHPGQHRAARRYGSDDVPVSWDGP